MICGLLEACLESVENWTEKLNMSKAWKLGKMPLLQITGVPVSDSATNCTGQETSLAAHHILSESINFNLKFQQKLDAC